MVNQPAMSVVMAAHNESDVIGLSLDALLGDPGSDRLDVTVAANGCTDDTADVARSRPVRVVELAEAGKTGALNAADRVAQGYPRIYLDADIALTASDLERLVRPLGAAGAEGRPVHAVVPARVVDVAGRPLLVRMYYAVSVRHPSYADGLFGRGAIALSQEGRARFDRFPAVLADDLFLDSLFAAGEKAVAADVVSHVSAPMRTRDLVRRLARVRRGNSGLRQADRQVRSSSGLGWLRELVREQPGLARCAVVYVGITVVAAILARWGRPAWGQDTVSRVRMRKGHDAETGWEAAGS